MVAKASWALCSVDSTSHSRSRHFDPPVLTPSCSARGQDVLTGGRSGLTVQARPGKAAGSGAGSAISRSLDYRLLCSVHVSCMHPAERPPEVRSKCVAFVNFPRRTAFLLTPGSALCSVSHNMSALHRIARHRNATGKSENARQRRRAPFLDAYSLELARDVFRRRSCRHSRSSHMRASSMTNGQLQPSTVSDADAVQRARAGRTGTCRHKRCLLRLHT